MKACSICATEMADTSEVCPGCGTPTRAVESGGRKPAVTPAMPRPAATVPPAKASWPQPTIPPASLPAPRAALLMKSGGREAKADVAVAERKASSTRAPGAELPAPSRTELTAEVVAESLTPAALTGRTIAGRYLILELLGEGGMGQVYKAQHQALDKFVCVKILRASLASNATLVSRFEREAKAASRLQHPNSIQVLDLGTFDRGGFYIAMEYVQGRSLAQVLNDEWPLPEERTCHIAAQILGALAAAHAAKVVHRDIKPENVMLQELADDPDHVKVLDFGIAKLALPEDMSLTRTDLLCGTPQFMSPEQATGAPLDGRSDLYSVGILLYRMVTGFLPFDGRNAVDLLAKQATEKPDPPRVKCPGVRLSPELERLILRALEKDPAQRPQTAEEFRREILAIEAARRVESVSPAARTTAGMPRGPDTKALSNEKPKAAASATVAGEKRVAAAGASEPAAAAAVAAPSEDAGKKAAAAAAPAPRSRRRWLAAVAVLSAAAGAGGWFYWDRLPESWRAKLAHFRTTASMMLENPLGPSAADFLPAKPQAPAEAPPVRQTPAIVVAAAADAGPAAALVLSAAGGTQTPAVLRVPETAAASAQNPVPTPIREAPPAGEVSAPVRQRGPRGCPEGSVFIPSGRSSFCIDRYEYPDEEGELPMVSVSWDSAQQLCRSRGRRLCTALEWELACRGPDRREYSKQKNLAGIDSCNTAGHPGPKGLLASGRLPLCTSRYGVADLSGNAAEWTATAPPDLAGVRVVKGANARAPVEASRCAAESLEFANSRSDLLGFRCCASAN